MDSKLVVYTDLPLSYISVATNDTLEDILEKINTAVNNTSAAPNFSGYNLYCIKEVDGVTHPTNNQNFAEGISKYVCDFHTAYTTFTGTTYISDKAVLTAGINLIQTPSLTYSPYSIVNTDTNTQVWNKLFTGLNGTIASINISGSAWSSIPASVPSTLVGAFNTIITKELAQDTAISGKQATISPFNNASNCLSTVGGTSSDNISTTIGLIRTYMCTLPTYDASSISGVCLTSGTTLANTVQKIINYIDGLSATTVRTAGVGMQISGTGCAGKTLGLDTSYQGLYKVAISSSDSSVDYLKDKVSSLDGTITLDSTTHPSKLDLSVATPVTNKVLVNSSDTTKGYLRDKIPSTQDPVWGLALNSNPSGLSGNINLQLVPTIGQPNLFWQALYDLIRTDPDNMILFSNLVSEVSNVPGTGVSDLIVSLSGTAFAMDWTHQSGISQNAKWRSKGSSLWNVNNLIPADPLSATAHHSAMISGSTNEIFEFAVDTIYSGGIANSNIYEMIRYYCDTLTSGVSSGVISVSIPVISDIERVSFNLYNNNAPTTILQSIDTSGSSPNGAFTAVVAGNYTVKWIMKTTVNGSTLRSDDTSQLNAACSSGTITV